MPSAGKKIGKREFVFDARPDRIDLRDRVYQPKLASLPREYPARDVFDALRPDYAAHILDQGEDGACTGFGLAAVINFQLFRLRRIDGVPVPFDRVSPAMLYRLARMYDEWPGADYEGSSCRGAMKGWHKHGVCREATWPHVPGGKSRPKPEVWREEAAQVPLGAYFRVDKDAVADLQSAIRETGAIFVSADVFGYWDVGPRGKSRTSDGLPIILPTAEPGEAGGHAFALVGYRPEGFIVQNSWGRAWGRDGFAILPYDEWVAHGSDAWVATIGAPTMTRSGAGFSHKSPASASWTNLSTGRRQPATLPSAVLRPTDPLPTESSCYRRTLVLANNGRVSSRFVALSDPGDVVREIAVKLPSAWFAARSGTRDLVIHAHGGMNPEEASIRRVRRMAPWFEANGIRPLFLTWRSGFLETLSGQVEDMVAGLLGDDRREVLAAGRAGGPWRAAMDRTIEEFCHRPPLRGLWREMKENAAQAASGGGGARLLARALRDLRPSGGGLRIHLIGHSAGAVLLGGLLRALATCRLPVASCHLLAPACTVSEALRTFGAAFAAGILRPENLFLEILGDAVEQSDGVGDLRGLPAYGKSLLYLVSRALEDERGTPLLGLERSWAIADPCQRMPAACARDVARWRQILQSTPARPGGRLGALTLHGPDRGLVSDGLQPLRLSHFSFDNDVRILNRAIARMLGRPAPLVPVTDLSGY